MKRCPGGSKHLMFHSLGLFLALLVSTVWADARLLVDAPPKPVRIPAEFEPMQAVVVEWQLLDNGDFYKYIAEDVKLILPYNSDHQYTEMQTQLAAYGVNLANCEFYPQPWGSIPRDFLPWLLFIDGNTPAFMQNEGSTPEYFLEQSYPVYESGLPIQGGDFMTDGQGTAVSFPWIVDFYAMMYKDTDYALMDRVRDYWGIHTYHLISNPVVKGLRIPPHIDCLAKFLSPDTILVVRYPSSHALYERTEIAAAYFCRQVSCYGTPYRVLRLEVPADEPYINSLIVNRRVFVPIMEVKADADALATYRAAMPGYEVIGITNRFGWMLFNALHCATLNIADAEMLYIRHVPLLDRPPASAGFPIRAEIEAYSGTEFVDGTPLVLWRTRADANDAQPSASWNTLAMARDPEAGDHQYLAHIPAQPVGTVVQYYLRARDASGRDETHPYIGEPQAHTFTVTALGANVSAVSARRGHAVEFYIDAGVDNAQETYRLAYSVLNDPNDPNGPQDADTRLPETAVQTGFEGIVDDAGFATAGLILPGPLASEWIGRSLRFSLEFADQQDVLPDTVTIQILE